MKLISNKSYLKMLKRIEELMDKTPIPLKKEEYDELIKLAKIGEEYEERKFK